MDNTSKIIKEIRAQLKLNQADFAAALGVSFATVNRWERGHFTPSPVALRALKQFCRENGIDFAQYEENYRGEEAVSLTLYGVGECLRDSLLLDSYRAGCLSLRDGDVLQKATLTLEEAHLTYLTNAGDFLFLNAFLSGVLRETDAPDRYRRCQALIKDCDVVVTYGITSDLSHLITRFYQGEITDRALGACLSLYTVGQGYLLISDRAKNALAVTAIDTVEETVAPSADMNEILKKYRRDGFYFDEIVEEDVGR